MLVACSDIICRQSCIPTGIPVPALLNTAALCLAAHRLAPSRLHPSPCIACLSLSAPLAPLCRERWVLVVGPARWRGKLFEKCEEKCC